jgi:isopentenyl-diphosphate delta-isomerase
MEDQVILVNEKDEMVGVGEKLKIHQAGLLHRAFSIFIVNARGELLLQRRALSKYHSPGLWSNTCCGHPRPGEQVMAAAQRRLKAEMGLDCRLEVVGSFIYLADVGDGLVEHEFDHLLVGHSDLEPTLNCYEAIRWKRVHFATLRRELGDRPEDFTCWLRVIIDTQLHKFPITALNGRHSA